MRDVVVVVISVVNNKWGPKTKRNLWLGVKNERRKTRAHTQQTNKSAITVKERLTLNPDVKQKVHILCIYFIC